MFAVRSLLVAFLCGVVLLNAYAAETSVRRYAMLDESQLALKVPDGWIDNVTQPSKEAPWPTIAFEQKTGKAFVVMVSAILMDPEKRPTSDQVQGMVRGTADKVASQAMERKLEVKPLKGETGTGYYFSATDKAPKPGEYKFMTQGIYIVGDIMMTFTILTNDGQAGIAKQTLGMIATAQHAAR